MTADLSGIARVEARIAEIQQRISPQAPPAHDAPPPAPELRTFDSVVEQLRRALPHTTQSSTTTNTPTSPVAGTAGPDALIAAAKKYLGVPYVWGGTSGSGLDCSGLVQKALGDIGISVPRVAADQARQGTPVASLKDAKPGDLVAFGKPVDHIGIYLGNNTMIVAPKRGDVVKVQQIYRTPTAIRRILPELGALGSIAATQPTAAASPGVSMVPGSALAAAPAEYRDLFVEAGRRHGVAPALLAAVARTESSFNPRAVSPVGARGLMQIMPGTARSLRVNPDVPAQAVDGAARLLAEHLRTFSSVELALAAYNAGPGAVKKYHGIPPYAETRNYVRTIMADQGVA